MRLRSPRLPVISLTAEKEGHSWNRMLGKARSYAILAQVSDRIYQRLSFHYVAGMHGYSILTLIKFLPVFCVTVKTGYDKAKVQPSFRPSLVLFCVQLSSQELSSSHDFYGGGDSAYCIGPRMQKMS